MASLFKSKTLGPPLLSVSNCDIYHIHRVPGASKQQAHRALSYEPRTVLNTLPPKSQEYYRTEIFNDVVNIKLWKEHSVVLGKLAVENRINKLRRRNTTESENQFPNDIKKWSQGPCKKIPRISHEKIRITMKLTLKKSEGKILQVAFLHLTEEEITRKPGLYELNPSPAENIMELVEELNKN
ncbi:10027_t:CDS:2 [Diversispora eburnea]|uniref:10027_t:CDS:1 n=1 Tax=Diversispora eburnea TaxID=1213867 RepID=A0A9N8ZN19_9GLOM|nr:10027_t:CDS:2 [Diversispora eburnea]